MHIYKKIDFFLFCITTLPRHRRTIMSCPTCGTFYKPEYFDPVKDETCPYCVAKIALQESEEKVSNLCDEGKNPTLELLRQKKLKKELEEEEEKKASDADITALHESKHDNDEEKFSSLEKKKSNAITILYEMDEFAHWREVEKIAEATTEQEIAFFIEQVMLKSRISSLKTIFSHSPKVHERIDTIQNAVQLETLMQELQVA